MDKRKVIILSSILMVLVVLTPIAIYGAEVDVARVSFDLSVDESLSLKTLSDFESLQVPLFVGNVSNMQVNVLSMNAYEYTLTKMVRTQVNGEEVGERACVRITITFSLITPENETLEFILSPGQGMGMGDSNVNFILGPDDGVVGGGEFYLTIVIRIAVTPPVMEEPVVDIVLEPVSMSFTIPAVE